MKLKNFLNKVTYFSAALFISLSLLSCQDEETEITNPEPSEVLENDSTLTNLISRAVSEEDTQGHITCLDFEYPISISVFDTSFDVADTENINTDAQFFSFLETLDGIIASINYPITAVFANEDVIEIIENQGLLSILLDAEGGECNDSVTVQGCTLESIKAAFLDCEWSIRNYSVNRESENYIITFNEDESVTISDNVNLTYLGTWAVFEEDEQLILNIDTDLIEISWQIVECSGEFVQASNDTDTILLIKDCTIETEEDPEITAAKEIIIGCTWHRASYIADGDNTIFPAGFFTTFEFAEDGTFIYSEPTTFYDGDWNLEKDGNNNLLLILHPSQSLPENIDYDYQIDTLTDGFMLWSAINTNQEIITSFEKDCTITEDPEITAAKEIIINDGCIWGMDRHNVDGERTFNATFGKTFEFSEDGVFIYNDSVTSYNGDWFFQKDEGGNLVLILEPYQSLPEYIDYDFTMSEFREGFMLWNANNTDQEIITGFEKSCN